MVSLPIIVEISVMRVTKLRFRFPSYVFGGPSFIHICSFCIACHAENRSIRCLLISQAPCPSHSFADNLKIKRAQLHLLQLSHRPWSVLHFPRSHPSSQFFWWPYFLFYRSPSSSGLLLLLSHSLLIISHCSLSLLSLVSVFCYPPPITSSPNCLSESGVPLLALLHSLPLSFAVNHCC